MKSWESPNFLDVIADFEKHLQKCVLKVKLYDDGVL